MQVKFQTSYYKLCLIYVKQELKIIPYITLGIILSESIVASDISKKLKGDFSLVQIDSIIKRIKRFFLNKHFNPYDFYDSIITNVIKKYKQKHGDKNVHIVFDHMCSHENYTVFMITLRVGSQGIPLWFRCFEYKKNDKAYQENLIKEGIKFVSDAFGSDYNLIFLADRWFNSTSLLDYIDSLGHIYCVRLKKYLKVFLYNQRKKKYEWKSLDNMTCQKHHSKYYNDIKLTEKEFVTNIVISSSANTDDAWIIATNGDVKYAIKNYSHRFGGIECMFKNQKTNGFNLEKCVKASLKYFESMYCMCCFSVLFITILGADFTKNSRVYKNIKIKTHTKSNKKKIRILSLFNTGLILFNMAFNSLKYIRIS